MKRMTAKAMPGMSIMEHGMIAVLVSIVGITSLSALGGSINGALDSFVNSLNSKSENRLAITGVTTANRDGAGAKTAQPGQVSHTSPAAASGKALQLSSGVTITLPHYPINARETVETAGGNGTTQLLASTLEAMAREAYEKGEITQTQYNGLINLANRGYDIAAAEKAAEDFMVKAQSDPGILMRQFTYQGETYYNVYGFAEHFGYSTHGDDGVFMRPFLDEFNAVVPTLHDPALKSMVSTLSQQIKSLGKTTEEAIGDIVYNNDELGVVGLKPEDYIGHLASNSTGNDSEQICKLGGGNVGGANLCQ